MKRGSTSPTKKTAPRSVVRAWLHMLAMSPEDAAKRPVRALAQSMGVSVSMASRNVRRMAQKGLLVEGRGRGVKVVGPREGCVIHCHGPDEVCRHVEKVNLSTFDVLVHFISASHRDQKGSSKNTSTCYVLGDLLKDKTHTHLKKLAEVYSVDKRTRRRNTEDDRLFLEAYTARRRRIDPLYEPSRKDLDNMAKARRVLASRHVPKTRFREYLDFVFERFPIVTGGRAQYPPTRTIGAEGFVDRFASELPPRRLNFKRAARSLTSAGFGDVNPEVVLDLVKRSLKAGGVIPSGLGDRYRQAVEWLINRIDSIGYEEETEE